MPSPLALVVCGAPLATRTPDLAEALLNTGWDVSVVATTAALAWLDEAKLHGILGQPALTSYRAPDQPKAARPAVVVASPVTFNSVNKLATGISDTYAASLLCESLGAGTPIVAVPMVNDRLWRHPVWSLNVSRLAEAGVTFLDVRSGSSHLEPVPSGTGDAVVKAFEPSWITAIIADYLTQ